MARDQAIKNVKEDSLSFSFPRGILTAENLWSINHANKDNYLTLPFLAFFKSGVAPFFPYSFFPPLKWEINGTGGANLSTSMSSLFPFTLPTLPG